MRFLTRFALAIASILVIASASPGQPRITDQNAHGWYNYFGDHPIGDSRWGIHLEGQWRRHEVITRWQQLLLRPAVNFEVNDKLMLSAGYGFIRSFPYGDIPAPARTDERRFWQQALIRYPTGKARWNTRIRFEERFLDRTSRQIGEPKYRFEDRIRIMQQVRYPLKGKTYATTYNEIWFYVKPYVSNSTFDQNRAYGALGWQLDDHWRLETGYMHQAILQRSGTVLESNHTLMISLISNAPFRK
ncbi:MAG: DUF2490 domain-containing protein [Bryobacterales bacterium]|nr:DUF2490 domain-containing protein [Bryobacterales bacterium]